MEGHELVVTQLSTKEVLVGGAGASKSVLDGVGHATVTAIPSLDFQLSTKEILVGRTATTTRVTTTVLHVE